MRRPQRSRSASSHGDSRPFVVRHLSELAFVQIACGTARCARGLEIHAGLVVYGDLSTVIEKYSGQFHRLAILRVDDPLEGRNTFPRGVLERSATRRVFLLLLSCLFPHHLAAS